MKKRILSILLTLVMVIGMLPTAVFAAEGDPEIYVGGVGMVSGNYLHEGETEVSTAEPTDSSVGYAYYNEGVLTLKNYDYTGDGTNGAAIYRGSGLEIVLIGENKLQNTGSDGNGIRVTNANLKMHGSGKDDKLTVIAKGAGIVTESSIVIEKCSIDFTTDMDGIRSKNESFGRISITNADVKVKTSGTGIYAYNNFSIADKSTVDIDAARYGIFVTNGKESSTVSGSTLSIDADNNGIAVKSDVSFTNTDLTIDAGETGISTNASVSFTDTDLTIDAKKNGISTYDGEVSFTDSTAKITAVLNGIFGMSNSDPSSVSVKNSDVEIKSTTTGEEDGGVWAINVSDKFNVAEGLTVQASAEPDGTLGAYVASAHNTYDRIKISGKTTSAPEPTVIESVSVTIAEPEEGKKPSYTATLPADAPYELIDIDDDHMKDGVQWAHGTTALSATSDSVRFEAGETYTVEVFLKAKDGYEFKRKTLGTYNFDDVEKWLNGKQDTGHTEVGEYYAGDDDVICVEMSFTVPTTTTPEIWVGGKGMVSGQYLDESGTVGTEELTDNYAYYKDGVLTLHNYSYSGAGYSGYAVYCPIALTMELEGENSLTGKGNEAIAVVGGLIIGGNGKLALSSDYEYCVYSTALTFQDSCTVTADTGIYTSGVLSVKETAAVILNGSGELSASQIDISGGTVTVTAIDNYGIYAGKDISISGGTITVTARKGDTYSGVGIYSHTGNIEISGGTVTVNADGNGINAYRNLTISGGTVTVTAGVWGIKAQHKDLTVSGGNIDVKSTATGDDDNRYYALSYSTDEGSLTFDKNLAVLASTEPDGTLVPYVKADNNTYDHVKIGTEPAPTTYTVTVTNGTGAGQYAENTTVEISAYTPESGYQFKEWTGADDLTFIDGTSKTSATAKFTMPAKAVTVTATYEKIPESEPTKYTVTLPTGTGYTAAAVDSSTSPVEEGGNYSFTVTIADGYKEGDDFAVKANGTELTEADGKYTITNITADQVVTVEGVVKDTPVDPEKTATPEITYDAETFTVTATGNGTVKLYKDGVEVSNPCVLTQTDAETTYTFTATAQEEGKLISDVATLEVTVPAKVVTPEPAQKYTITYTDGVDGKEIFVDFVFTDVEEGSATPTISNPTRSGYTFTGWTPAVAATVTGNQTYTATWDENSTDGGIVIPTVFPVTVKESDNGEIEASAKYAVPGSTVKLTVTPDEGYELDTLIVKSGSKFINVTEKNGKYQFVMPFGSATVTATFKAVNPYNDVDTDDWFYDDVLYVTLKDLMNGTGDGKFSPEITTDRAMLVTVLWRLEGCPVVDSSVAFDDVADGLWYSDAIDWASANGIVNGYGNGKFGPTDQITREQIMAILNRYAAYKNWTDGTALPMIPQYNCSVWAENNVIWADMNGLLNGLGVDITDMTAKASRAELAAYLARFMQNIVK